LTTVQATNGPEPGLCCYHLSSGARYDLRVVVNSNTCCGVNETITLTNTHTHAIVGTLPCAMTKFLAPLMMYGLIRLSGSITTLVHPVVESRRRGVAVGDGVSVGGVSGVDGVSGDDRGDGGVEILAPPFELSVEVDMRKMVAMKKERKGGMRGGIRKIRQMLQGWEGDWIHSEYPANVFDLVQLLK
jgi:hypothetical protein